MKLLTKKEAAEMMRCSTIFIDRLRKRGKLSFVKIGKLVFLRDEDIINYIESCVVKGDNE